MISVLGMHTMVQQEGFLAGNGSAYVPSQMLTDVLSKF